MKPRTYTQRRRAQQQAQTRERIVQAAMALHEERGPRRTTISAVARRAGVQRLTVYRHFHDDRALFSACSSRWLELNPPPSPQQWRGMQAPAAGTRQALSALYGYYRHTERMWAQSYRDREAVPALDSFMADIDRYMDAVATDLLSLWRPARSRRRALGAVIRHALAFASWRSLADQGLRDAEMVDLVERWLEVVAREAEGEARAGSVGTVPDDTRQG
ncbi:MAG TPA: helix-turn-helix domain-containing protein [Gammaproteobacteria bacterium]|nr:helix-turn-helix domain-containing protein [Gammaproteobacteria bacterium]